jgi:Flp pilus assembly protein TadD
MPRPRLIVLLLAMLTLAVYLPVVHNGFILYDDGDYVTRNKIVQGGLTLAGIKWAFTSFAFSNWHPLTWLSHMMDCELFGVSAAGSHFISMLLHTANVILLFVLWMQMLPRPRTGSPGQPDGLWPAAFIAALFAVHPLHVESVAWAAERKDVLSTFFGLLTLLCYTRYATGTRLPCVGPVKKGHPSISYWLALVFFACGLMSKPMLVTWPFVMLLLDYWPLQRLNVPALRALLVEKIPFFLLTIASCIVTYLAQNTGAVKTLASVPPAYRLENAVVAVAAYLLKLVWPARLAIIYPMPNSISPALFIVSLAVLILVTVVAWLARKKNPSLLVGWFWFLGTLVPVIGLVKVGDAAMADRYMYIPSIGIFVAVAFGAQQFSKRLPQFVLPSAVVFILVALTCITERQLQYWRNGETIFKHALDVTTDNLNAVLNYGAALDAEGKPVQAIAQYRRVQQMAASANLAGTRETDLFYACDYLGNLLYMSGKTNEALAEYTHAEQLNPESASVRDRIGLTLAGLGHYSEATNEWHESIRLDPYDPAPHTHLGLALSAHNDFADATNEFLAAMRVAPGNPIVFVQWAEALLQQGRDAGAIDAYNHALQLDPDNYQALSMFARLLASDESPAIRDGTTALTLARKAHALTNGNQPGVEDVLGMAYAETGQFEDAQKAVQNGIRIATGIGMNPDTIAGMQLRLELYQKHQPWRESFLLSNTNSAK